jgi:hypothetical protein
MIKAFETSLDASNPQNLALFTKSVRGRKDS